MGFDPMAAADRHMDRFLHWYAGLNHRNSKHCFVPGGPARWAGKSAADFLSETGLQAVIDEMATRQAMPVAQDWVERELLNRIAEQDRARGGNPPL